MMTNGKLLFLSGGFKSLPWGYLILTLVLLIHNLCVLYYCFQLSKWYFSMGTRNMHAVEEVIIGQLYDKARFHKMEFSDRKFYYTRGGGWFENLSEMMGTRNILRWLIPMPHYGR